MQIAPLPPNEEQRLAELQEYQILDTLPEQAYDDITFLATQICGSEIAVVSLVDRHRQWFKSVVGLDERETSRDVAFCAHAITAPDDLMIVPDATADERFAANPLVRSDPSIRFYAGAPLITPTGSALGTLCVIDRHPRQLSEPQRQALAALSRQVMAQMELRRNLTELEELNREHREYQRRLEEYQRQLEENLDHIAEQSRTDPLTGLRNRRELLRALDEECERFRRYGTPVSVAMMDVDHFKHYNDAHGHVAGDAVLAKLAGLVSGACRTTDIVARFGGEEFAVVLTNTDAPAALVLSERLRRAVDRAEWHGRPVTVSVGVATVHPDDDRPLDLLERADEALYEAKDRGRNCVHEAA